MARIKNRRKKLFANEIHRELFLLILTIGLLPMLLMAILVCYLIFGLGAGPGAEQYVIPARLASILFVAMPIIMLIIIICAHKIVHMIVGPYNRIVKELGEYIEGKRQGRLAIRRGDRFGPLVDNINKLIDKLG
jgi:methyl-accepting chemotaxis protein